MCVSGGRGAENFSFDEESFCDFSEAGYHVWDVNFGDMMFCGGFHDFCGTRAHPCFRKKVTLVEQTISPLHECMSPVSLS